MILFLNLSDKSTIDDAQGRYPDEEEKAQAGQGVVVTRWIQAQGASPIGNLSNDFYHIFASLVVGK